MASSCTGLFFVTLFSIPGQYAPVQSRKREAAGPAAVHGVEIRLRGCSIRALMSRVIERAADEQMRVARRR